jgi:hypothetical protein
VTRLSNGQATSESLADLSLNLAGSDHFPYIDILDKEKNHVIAMYSANT